MRYRTLLCLCYLSVWGLILLLWFAWNLPSVWHKGASYFVTWHSSITSCCPRRQAALNADAIKETYFLVSYRTTQYYNRRHRRAEFRATPCCPTFWSRDCRQFNIWGYIRPFLSTRGLQSDKWRQLIETSWQRVSAWSCNCVRSLKCVVLGQSHCRRGATREQTVSLWSDK